MSDEEVKRMIEEATKEAMTQSFTEAGKKYIRAAEACETKGDFAEAENLHKQAAGSFLKAAEKYRASKSFKIAALNMCLAGDVYSELADAENALKSYELAAEDLIGASTEHLMWGEDAETKKGTALAITASMIYLMIGKDDIAFAKARSFNAEHSSKIRFPGVVRLSQIPQMLESAIQSMDLNAFSDAETAAVVELKAALSSANAQEFTPYVDKGVEMVREILRGKLKVPKITSQIFLPVDMTFSEEFTVKAIVENKGDGSALRLTAEWYIDEGLVVVAGNVKKSVGSLPPGETMEHEITIKSSEEIMGEKEYSLLVRGSYNDDLKTEYTLQAGPGTLILKDFKESEKLLQDLDVTEGRVSVLSASIEQSKMEQEPLKRVSAQLSPLLTKARENIETKDLPFAKAQIGVANELIDSIDAIIGDSALQERLLKARESQSRRYAKETLDSISQSIQKNITDEENKLQSEATVAMTEWDSDSSGKKRIADSIGSSKDMCSGIKDELEEIYNIAPAASTTDDPELASKLTKIRTMIETLKTKTSAIETELEGIASHTALRTGERPTTHPKIELADSALKSIRAEIVKTIDSKISEME
ncbi:MAG: hypothetical protein ACTSV2_04365 [Candidatus Thorarchaeota archaeon]